MSKHYDNAQTKVLSARLPSGRRVALGEHVTLIDYPSSRRVTGDVKEIKIGLNHTSVWIKKDDGHFEIVSYDYHDY